MKRRLSPVGLAVMAWIVAGCGSGDASVPVPVTSVAVGESAIVGATVDVESVGSQQCYSARVPVVGVELERSCAERSKLVFSWATVQHFVDGGASANSVIVYLASVDGVVVDRVEQDGEPVEWIQDGQGLLVVGRSPFVLDTTIEFEVSGRNGRCDFGPTSLRCTVAP